MDLNINPTGVTTGLASLMSDGNAKTITLESRDKTLLEKGAEQVEKKLESVPGVIKVQNTTNARKTNVRFNIDQQAAQSEGLQPSAVAGQIYNMLNGIKAATVDDEELDKVDIRLQYPDDEYNDPRVLLSQSIQNQDGKSVALKDICEFEFTEIPLSIHRVDDKFIGEIKAVVRTGDKYRISKAVNDAAKEVILPEGVGFETIWEKKNIDIEADIEQDIFIVSDPELLSLVWNNLLSNALKFTPEGGKVSLSLKKDGEKAVVRIADTGCGISEENQKHIFDKFYQADRSHASEGNGLGLALVKTVLERVNGELMLTSELGKGTEFTVKL